MRPIGLEKYWDIDHRLWPKLSPNIVVASPIFLKKEKKNGPHVKDSLRKPI